MKFMLSMIVLWLVINPYTVEKNGKIEIALKASSREISLVK